MQLYKGGKGCGQRSDIGSGRHNGTYPLCVNSAFELLRSIVETACEHDRDLDLMRLVNYMDLYRLYLTEFQLNEPNGATDIANRRVPVCFENFVGDTHLLSRAASAACDESFEKVAAPAPLVISANESSSCAFGIID